ELFVLFEVHAFFHVVDRERVRRLRPDGRGGGEHDYGADGAQHGEAIRMGHDWSSSLGCCGANVSIGAHAPLSRQARSPAGAARWAARARLAVRDCRGLAELEPLLSRGRREQMPNARDDPRPPGLMARAEPGAVVAGEVFVEEDQVPPMRVVLE